MVDGEVAFDVTDAGLEFTDGPASGTIELDDGSTLTFENVEKIEW